MSMSMPTRIDTSDDAVARIPTFGSGLGYRRELRAQTFAAREAIDFLELLTDQFIEEPRHIREVEEVCAVFPAIPHGIGLSVGSAGGLDDDYLQAIKRISDITGSPYYSEHLCMTRAPGIDIGHLSPLWFTEEVLAQTIANVRHAQEVLEKPLVLENVTYLFDIPGGTISQAEFFQRLVAETGCGILLDLTNVYINSVNHGLDPIAFIEALPLERVVQVHLAGGYWAHNMLIDGHSEPVQEESWRLLEFLVGKIDLRACILEHDANFPETIAPLLEQVARARAIMQSRTPGAETATRAG